MAAALAKELGWLCSAFPESSRISERQPPQLNPPKIGPQQRLLSLMSFHCFILSASVISDSGPPPVVRSHRPRRCCSFRLVCSEPAASSFLPFFLSFFVQGYKFKTCLSCVVSGPFLAPSSVLRPPPARARFQPFLLHTQLLPPQLRELGPTAALRFSAHPGELSSIVSSV